MFQHLQINTIKPLVRIENRNHNHTSIDAEKLLDNIQHPFTIKALKKLRIKRMYLNIIKAMYNKSISSTIARVLILSTFIQCSA
jgi:hypothetical protein